MKSFSLCILILSAVVLLTGEGLLREQRQASAAGSATLDYNVRVPWADTGIDVVAGELITIAATGSATYDRGHGDHYVTPDGDSPAHFGGWDDCNVHSLVAWVGTYQPGATTYPLSGVLCIGSSFSGTATASGRLYIVMNDYNGDPTVFTDNYGTWHVEITGGQVCAYQYVATGDSVAYGADMTTRIPYPDYLFNDHVKYLPGQPWCETNLAQSGAKTSHYINGEEGFTAQLQPAIDEDPRLVTITIGANNFVMTTLMDTCMPMAEKGGIRAATACIKEVFYDKKNIYWDPLRDDLRTILDGYLSSPDYATLDAIAVTGYYDPMPVMISDSHQNDLCNQFGNTKVRTSCNQWGTDLSTAMNWGYLTILKLNDTIKGVVDEYSAWYQGKLTFVDVDDQFAGHCSTFDTTITVLLVGSASLNLGCTESDSWIVANHTKGTEGFWKKLVFDASVTSGVHPNEKGQQCISNLVWEAVKAKLGSWEPPVSDPCP